MSNAAQQRGAGTRRWRAAPAVQVQAWRPPNGEPATALRGKPVTVRPAARHPATARTDVERRDEHCSHIDRSKESKHRRRRRFVFSWKQACVERSQEGKSMGHSASLADGS